MLIDDTPEYDLVWDKVYGILKFTPSVDRSIMPFEKKEEYAIYSFDFYEIAENRINLEEVIGNIFVDISEDDTKMYALDWQHSAFLYNPKNKEEQKSFWKEDNRYWGGGYYAFFPPFIPDGDYLKFLLRYM